MSCDLPEAIIRYILFHPAANTGILWTVRLLTQFLYTKYVDNKLIEFEVWFFSLNIVSVTEKVLLIVVFCIKQSLPIAASPS
jgi:lipid-A-disaccharide synthase-like uncharacterized protein